ncbi:MAG: hypothetical protein KF784_06980 [Fimbriimonadaceae bacterium]|nr:hypothetical protein [Fimbriimonadaceae bacterium]
MLRKKDSSQQPEAKPQSSPEATKTRKASAKKTTAAAKSKTDASTPKPKTASKAKATAKAAPKAPAKKPTAKATPAKAEPVKKPTPAKAKTSAKTSTKAKPSAKKEAAAKPAIEAEATVAATVIQARRSGKKSAPTTDVVQEPTRSKRGGKKPAPKDEAEAHIPQAEPTLIPEFEEEGWTLSWREPQRRSKSRPAEAGQTDSEEGGARRGRRRRRRGGGRGREGEEAALETVETAVQEFSEPVELLDDEEMPEITFRPRDGQAEAPKGRREPSRRQGGRQDKAAAKEPEPQKVTVPEPPPKPVKPLIPTPKDAPQVVLRNGIPTIVRNHKVYPPVSFFGSASDERRANNVLEQIKRAGEAGIHLHSHLIEFEVDPANVASDVSLAAYLLAKTVEVDPEAQVIFRMAFIAPAGWQNAFPDAKYLNESGRTAEPSVCDDEFWGVARECLAEFISAVRELPQSGHIMGVHLERGEWFHPAEEGYDTSKAAVQKFRDWAVTRYRNDIIALRAAWFDGTSDFKTLDIPPFMEAQELGEKFMRVNRKERRWVDYHLFLSDVTVERIADLAYTAKEASEGNFLVGVSYGYTFEWTHPSSGHLSLGKLLRTPEVDIIAGPPSYRTREAGGSAAFPTPIDSFPLNGKMYLSEEDYKTSISNYKEPDDFNPVIKTPQALESVHWRGIGMALAHASGVCWMDLWGNGWLNTPAIWTRGEQAEAALTTRMGANLTAPDVAVFIDERSLAYLVDQDSFALLVQNVRESVLRSGLSAGFYLLSDLTHREQFPESKLYIFLNAWDIRPEMRASIKSRLQRDNKVLFWLYGAGIFDSGREALERAREITGIALKPQPFSSRTGTTLLNRRHPLCEAFGDQGMIGGVPLHPSYFAIPEEATILGEYTQTGLPSFVIREFNEEPDRSLHWTSVFMGEPVVTPALVRSLGQLAGAHVWNFQDDVVHVRAPFLTVHCTGTGPRTITLPSNWSAYNLLRDQWVQMESTSIKFHAIDGSTHVFLVGVKSELEALLATPPEELLHMEDIPTQDENTLRHDLMTFDVQVMALNDWMEGGLPEEVSEDWFLPRNLFDAQEQVEAEGEEPEVSVGRHRRKRRQRGRGGNNEGGAGMPSFTFRSSGASSGSPEPNREAAGTDIEMNVMFRKRD